MGPLTCCLLDGLWLHSTAKINKSKTLRLKVLISDDFVCGSFIFAH